MNRLKIAAAMVIALCLLTGCGDKAAGPVVGEAAPDFTLKDTTGKTWQLSQLRGQVVFINFWATWCPPCLKELPSMQKLFTIHLPGRYS